MNERQNEARENHSENHRMSAVFCIFGEGWGGGDINHVHQNLSCSLTLILIIPRPDKTLRVCRALPWKLIVRSRTIIIETVPDQP